MDLTLEDAVSMVNSLTDKVMTIMDTITIDSEKQTSRNALIRFPQFAGTVAEELSHDPCNENNLESIYCTPRRPRKPASSWSLFRQGPFCLGRNGGELSNTSSQTLHSLQQNKDENDKGDSNKVLKNELVSVQSNIIDAINLTTEKRKCNQSLSSIRGYRSTNRRAVNVVSDLSVKPKTTISNVGSLESSIDLSEKSRRLESDNTDEFENDLKFLSTCQNKTSTPDVSQKRPKAYLTQEHTNYKANGADIPYHTFASLDSIQTLFSGDGIHPATAINSHASAAQLPNGNPSMVSLLRQPSVSESATNPLRAPVRRCLPFTTLKTMATFYSPSHETLYNPSRRFRNEDEEAVYYLITKYLENKDMTW